MEVEDMLSISNKIRPIIAIDLDRPEDEWKHILLDSSEPLIFLKKENELCAYLHLNRFFQHKNKENLSAQTLVEHAHSLEHVCRLNKKVTLPILFQIIGESIALCVNEEGTPYGYIRREDLLAKLFKHDNKNMDLLKIILTSIPMGIFIVDQEKRIVNYNETGLKMIKTTSEKVLNVPANKIFNKKHINTVFATGETVLNELQITDEMSVLVDYSPILNFHQQVEGLVIIVQDLPMVEEMALEIEYVKHLNEDLNAILSSIYDEILVVTHEGDILRVSENLIEGFWGIHAQDLLGKNILDLENEGLFRPSVARLVMEKKRKVSIVQETKDGKKILAVGNPIYNEQKEIQRIIIASRDITETTRLRTELREMKKITDKYKQELDTMKSKNFFYKEIIYCSEKMEEIMIQAKRVADFSSTVLIDGESGVGKEVIAQAIHQFGKRSHEPFLKLNCGAIPENLLESELFGYTKGAFTGALESGKKGYFERANKGILFLDEIGELPMHLQVKLLRILQEQEVIPIGSTTSIKVDVQIIAATNKNLAEMVKNRTFREDLYYRLNVIPIHVPPLRERPEDIPVLAFHFLQQLNEKYDKDYYLTPDALNLLEVYPWPGNIRELQNIIERLFVSTDHRTIDASFVQHFLAFGPDFKSATPSFTKVIPLQEAQKHVEKQLILLAMKQYKTTTKAAKALGISQSSVSRKYQKILHEEKIREESLY